MKVSKNPKREALKALLKGGAKAFINQIDPTPVFVGYIEDDNGDIHRMTPEGNIKLSPQELQEYKNSRAICVTLDLNA